MTSRKSLETAIADLRDLLNTNSAKELDFQEWLEIHQIVFQVLGFTNSISHPTLPLDESAISPDFLVQRPNGIWEIFEIKRPDTEILKNQKTRSTFYSSTQAYISQCSEYADRCSQEHVREHLREKYNIEMNSNPESTILAGRAEGLDQLKTHSILARQTPKIRLITYDDLLEELERHYQLHFGNETERPEGISIYLPLSFLDNSFFGFEQTIIDIGSKFDRNRISFSRTGEHIAKVNIIDDDGLKSADEVDLSKYVVDKIYFTGIHLIPQNTHNTILFEVNGVYAIEKRLPSQRIILDQPTPFTIGADMNGNNHANIITAPLLSMSPPLRATERSFLRQHMFDHIWSSDEKNMQQTGLTFASGQFMYSGGHPIHDKGKDRNFNLLQGDRDRRPHLSSWETDPDRIEINAPIGLIKSRFNIK